MIPNENKNAENNSEIPSDLDELLLENRRGTITDERQQRLENYLQNNAAARAHYLSLCAIEGLIPSASERLESDGDASDEVTNVIPFSRKRKRVMVTAFSAAAVMLVALGVHHFFVSPSHFPPKELRWQVTNVFGAAHGDTPIRAGERTGSDAFAIDSGLAEIVLAQGARVLLEAPASLEVTGANSCKLNYGKAVVDVPNSAIGFTMESPHNRIIDHGTRFAVDASQGKPVTFVGVLSGMVDVEDGGRSVRLYSDYAVEQGDSSPISVPLDRSEFFTEMPAREYAWNFDGEQFKEPKTFSYDVTPLMKIPGDEIVIVYKWLTGKNTIRAKEFRLERDGQVVQTMPVERGQVGRYGKTFDNNFVFKLPAEMNSGKRWTMQVTMICDDAPEQRELPVSARGVFLFEKNLLRNADFSQFVGRWEYSFDGLNYAREFYPDGSWRLHIDGDELVGPNLANGDLCTVEDGVLSMPFLNPRMPVEKAVLRDDGILIFMNLPYRNAVRVGDVGDGEIRNGK